MAVISEPYEVVSPYSKVTVVDELLAFTLPFRVTVVFAIDVGSSVIADGTDKVVNVISSPLEVPSVFVAVTLKWYVVPCANPVRLALTGVFEFPVTGLGIPATVLP